MVSTAETPLPAGQVQPFLAILEGAYPDCRICSNLAVSQLVSATEADSERIQELTVDFAIIDDRARVIGVVELDSFFHHHDLDTMFKDGIKDQLFEEAGIPLKRVSLSGEWPTVDDVRSWFFGPTLDAYAYRMPLGAGASMLYAHGDVVPKYADTLSGFVAERAPIILAAAPKRNRRMRALGAVALGVVAALSVGAAYHVIYGHAATPAAMLVSRNDRDPTFYRQGRTIGGNTAVSGCATNEDHSRCVCFDSHGATIAGISNASCLASVNNETDPLLSADAQGMVINH